MSDRPRIHQDRETADEAVTIRFAEKFAHSPQFMAVFHEGMNLVEETAGYLDGDGRTEARALSREASLAYASESMRLTTRLMQLASWLLLHRAVNEGELTAEEARSEKHKVRLSRTAGTAPSAAFDELPERLRGLIGRSLRLHERVAALDRMMYGRETPAAAGDNPILSQLGRLERAFTGPVGE